MFKRSIAKLNQAMGFQRSSTNKPKMQPGNDRSTSMRTTNIKSHPITSGPISINDASYDTWVVSCRQRLYHMYYI